MADVLIGGIVVACVQKQYDFRADDGKQMKRDGYDVTIVGGDFTEPPDLVEVDDHVDARGILDAGQFCRVEFGCASKKKGVYTARLGQVKVVALATGEPPAKKS